MTETFKERIELLDETLSDKFKYYHGTSERSVAITENLMIIVCANEYPSKEGYDRFLAFLEMTNFPSEELIDFHECGKTPRLALEEVLGNFHHVLGTEIIDINDLLKPEQKG